MGPNTDTLLYPLFFTIFTEDIWMTNTVEIMEGFIYILLWLVTGVIFGVMSIVSWAVTTAENEYKNRSKR